MPKTKPAARLSVRMYRQGLGDCFLITIPAAQPFHMLIDCGVVLGTSDPSTIMTKVVEDIIATTGGRIDVLVATHEHWDHVSGFVQVEKLFRDRLRVNDVWLAWTEDPKSKLAAKLRAERRTAEKGLRMAVQHLALHGAADTAGRIDSLVSFFGAAPGSTETALTIAKSLAQGQTRYCSPEDPPITLDAAPGVRFYVLGPPQDEKLIKKSNPGKGEAYSLDAGPDGSQRYLLSALTRYMDAAGPAATGDPNDEPFDAMYAIPITRAEQVPFFAERYFGESADEGIYDRTFRAPVRDQSWRRIDGEWLESAEAMALQLDSATNNTSLVLAIEFTATGEVLLFPGDAQAGNWLSWQKLSWDIPGKAKPVTGPELLARTVFYKVGHHGSHNATLQALGLELMESDALTAMIPVDHAMAVKKRWGRMPLPGLVSRLREKTRGRLLSIDDKATDAATLLAARPDGTADTDWTAFVGRVAVTPLYYELRF